MRKLSATKIVSTLGPASNNEDMIRKLYRAGVTMFRINSSHGDMETHKRTLDIIRKVEKENYVRVNDTHEAIIDKDIFEKVQVIHKERNKRVIKQYDYLLRGLTYCKHCRLANANCIKS